MKYLVTLEIDDPEGVMGPDSPDPSDEKAWAHYLDLDGDETFLRVVKVEVVS